jgi:NADP-dependent 3-hydroxy acid dehydrogenase YdfG
MKLLTGKIAIVTGASSGIGRSIATLFAEQGAAVVLTARREVQLEEVAEAIHAKGGRAEVVAGDVALPQTH